MCAGAGRGRLRGNGGRWRPCFMLGGESAALRLGSRAQALCSEQDRRRRSAAGNGCQGPGRSHEEAISGQIQ